MDELCLYSSSYGNVNVNGYASLTSQASKSNRDGAHPEVDCCGSYHCLRHGELLSSRRGPLTCCVMTVVRYVGAVGFL